MLLAACIAFLAALTTVSASDQPPIHPIPAGQPGSAAESYVVARGEDSWHLISVAQGSSIPWHKQQFSVNGNPVNPLAFAGYADEIDQVGWSFLNIEVNPDASKEFQAFVAGYGEGAVSHRRLWMHLLNSGARDAFPDEQMEYIRENLKWMKQEITLAERETKRSLRKVVFEQVDLILRQIDGIAQGYNAHRNASAGEGEITFMDIYKLNLAASDSANLNCVLHPAECKKNIDDLISGKTDVTLSSSNKYVSNLLKQVADKDKCTMFVKPLPDGSDMLVSHNANDDLMQMTRKFARYHFPFISFGPNKTPLTLTFSGYPGLVLSTDDFTITHPNHLVVMSTTLTCVGSSGFANRTSTTHKLWTFLRNAIATRLAKNGEAWMELFDADGLASGTGLNEYLVVDYNRFAKRAEQRKMVRQNGGAGKEMEGACELLVPHGTVTMGDELPNGTSWVDLTEAINERRWWGGWNAAHMPAYRSVCRMDKVWEWTSRKFGNLTADQQYSADRTGRAKILAREQVKVSTKQDVAKMMRFNDYKNDEFAKCDFCKDGITPWLAPSPRNDILDPADNYGPFNHIVGARCCG